MLKIYHNEKVKKESNSSIYKQQIVKELSRQPTYRACIAVLHKNRRNSKHYWPFKTITWHYLARSLHFFLLNYFFLTVTLFQTITRLIAIFIYHKDILKLVKEFEILSQKYKNNFRNKTTVIINKSRKYAGWHSKMFFSFAVLYILKPIYLNERTPDWTWEIEKFTITPYYEVIFR